MADTILLYEDRANIARLTQFVQRNARSLCDNIEARYFSNIEKEIDAFYIYGRPLNPYSLGSELIKGFLIAKYSPDRAHILLVCAKRGTSGVGLALINRFIEDAKAKGVTYVTLDALPQVINYYRNKFKFLLSKTCEEDEKIQKIYAEMPPRPNFSTMEEVHEDPYMVELLNRVIDLGLSVNNKQCRSERAASRRDQDLNYLYWCSRDGYLMTLCLKEPVVVEPEAKPMPEKRQSERLSQRGKRIKVS